MESSAFIAGNTTGDSPVVKAKFNKLHIELEQSGYRKIFQPRVLDVDNAFGWSWEETIRYDAKKMLDCNSLHLLPDWMDSRCAVILRDTALRLGIIVIYH